MFYNTNPNQKKSMKKQATRTILCFLAFGLLLSISVPKVSALTIAGCIDKRQFQRVIRLHENEIRHCYNVALLKDKKLTGRVKTMFLVNPDGIVEKALIAESTLNNPEVEQCIVDHIEKWVFYKYENSRYCNNKTIVTYTYNFVSNYKPPTFLEHIKLILNEDDMKIEYFDVQPAPQED